MSMQLTCTGKTNQLFRDWTRTSDFYLLIYSIPHRTLLH